MSLADYLVGLARLALLLIPAVGFGRLVRVTLMTLPSHSLEWLVDIVVTISVLVVGSEALGIVALDRYWVLTSLLWIVGAVVVAVQRSSSTRRPSQPEFAFGASPEATGSTHRPVEPAPPTPPAPAAQRLRCGVAAAALAVVWGQWGLLTSDAYGGGILSFDSLWYHLPFAASFAQTGSVSRVLFTQADPFVAYYPANAELFHSIGLIAMGSDLLSPMVNLAWLAVALLAAWCCGRPWRIEPITLTAGCLIVGVPILGAGQPGSAFNDIFGLAMMMAAIALAVATDRHRGMYVACGLALGLAIGTKVTFAVPAVTIGCGTALVMPAGRRIKTLGLLGIPALLTGGWWYLRATLDTGDPLGLRVHIGPIVLPGPDSPLASAASQTVSSALAKPHLFGSRLAPGLNYALGPLWPLLLAGSTAGLVVAVVLRHRPTKSGVIAMAGICAALAYLVFPTGASQIEQQTQLFAVNLRYATPAIAIGLLLAVGLVADYRPRLLTALALLMGAALIVTQFEAQLWPRQTARHAAFAVAAAVIIVVPARLRRLRSSPTARWTGLTVAAILCVAAGFGLERHYFARRYLSAAGSATPIGQLYRWAQGISHSRLALYGTVEQYPFYGARVTNRVDYLGRPAANGGYAPIATCREWRTTLSRGDYQYVIETPAPTAAVPAAWTTGDAAATVSLQPAPGYDVYRLNPATTPTPC